LLIPLFVRPSKKPVGSTRQAFFMPIMQNRMRFYAVLCSSYRLVQVHKIIFFASKVLVCKDIESSCFSHLAIYCIFLGGCKACFSAAYELQNSPSFSLTKCPIFPRLSRLPALKFCISLVFSVQPQLLESVVFRSRTFFASSILCAISKSFPN
jgi:hypothetical protein